MKTLDHLSKYLDRLGFAVKSVRFFALVGGVGLISVGHYFRGSTAPWQADNADMLFWIGAFILLFAHLLLVFLDKQSVETIRSLYEAEQQIDKLKNETEEDKLKIEALIAWNTLSRLLSELLDQVLTINTLDAGSRHRVFAAAVEFIADRKRRLFGVEDDYLNISLYEYDEADKELHCVACFRSRPSDAKGPHRTWRVGEGHVGKAFELQSELVCADARAPDVASWIAARPGKQKEDDAEKYVSLIAVPVAVDPKNPLGVIIVTSDVPQRFVNSSEVASESEQHHRRYAVESLQDIAVQLAHLMYILRSKWKQQTEKGGSDGSESQV